MRIKQLELVGFKSFPQRTLLEIPSGITAIVGPNGCGKSNVVDAIRWVLGEQSPKHLRGDSMESVIFNGNDRLAPLGMAEVSLTFEGGAPARPASDLDIEISTLPAHFRDLGEIMVTRRYYRSGDSEYFINKIPCRLKDITELFLGTGVGSKAYGIIEQGRVEQLISAKPEDRRLFIEEAAGTTLYRSRKLAAERKMERTRENLARVNDVLREIERQVSFLERQAKKAEEYRRLQAEVRDLALLLASAQWRRLQSEIDELNDSCRRLDAEEQQRRASVDAFERSRQEAGAAVARAEERQAGLRESIAVLEAERESLRERLQMLEEERQERERRRARLIAQIEQIRSARAATVDEVKDAEREREACARHVAVDEEALRSGEERASRTRSALAEAREALESAKATLVEHITGAVEVRNSLAALERRREEIGRQLGKLNPEKDALIQRLRRIDEECARGRERLAALRDRVASAAGEKESHAEHLRRLAEARRRNEHEVSELEAVLLQVQSRLESIEKIQRNYEGFQRGVRAIMREEQHVDGVIGVVADVIEIPQEHERAVAAALGERLQYVIVEEEEHGAEAVDLLRRQASGRGSFIPVQPRANGSNGLGSLNGTSRKLLDLVRVDERFQKVAESLLGEVVLVPDLRSAVELWRRNGVRVTLVTPEGDVIDPSGVITGGSDRPIEEEILARRREIETLRANIAETAGAMAGMRERLAATVEEMARHEAALQELDAGVHELTVQIVATEKDLERLNAERPQCASRLEVVGYEIDAMAGEDRSTAEEAVALGRRLEELEEEHRSLEATVARRRTDVDRVGQELEAVNADLTALKVRVAERKQREQALLLTIANLRRSDAELSERETSTERESEAAERERESLKEQITTARAREVEQAARHEALQRDLALACEESRRVREVLAERERQVREAYEALEQVRAERSQVEINRSELRLRAEHLTQTMRERYEVDIAAQQVEPAGEEPGEEEATRLEMLKARLARLGDVNVAAIDELRELQERAEFLRTQRDDLVRSLSDLERTIQKLNRASRARFAETFARANEMFQKVFPRLFRGGEARLVLTDEQDLLESGVEIIVRPPGKRLDTVALLSGGEKALVAVSLIFSLFLINPTPFCILDEVDAPLDDANIGRFGQMIREMSERSQFLIITHNKRTMECADVLYGVTMQEPGVSKVISVSMR
jgi:chromosome segregation protein